jgi:hypothetical protein
MCLEQVGVNICHTLLNKPSCPQAFGFTVHQMISSTSFKITLMAGAIGVLGSTQGKSINMEHSANTN